MASASARTISRLVTKPLAFRPFLHGRDGLPVWSGSSRWSTTQTTQDKPAESEPVKSSSNETDNTTHHPSRSLSPKKVYRFNIPDRVWKAPIATKENPLKYNINRTIPFSTLPVYSIMKPGLGQIWTVIKRLDGDLQVRVVLPFLYPFHSMNCLY
jgi:hypothetical protein